MEYLRKTCFPFISKIIKPKTRDSVFGMVDIGYFFVWIFGMAPFKQVKNGKSYSYIIRKLSLRHVGPLIAYTVYIMYQFYDIPNFDTFFEKSLYVSTFGIIYILTSVQLVATAFKQRSLLRLLYTYENIDIKFLKLNKVFHYHVLNRVTIVMIVLAFVAPILTFSIMEEVTKRSTWDQFKESLNDVITYYALKIPCFVYTSLVMVSIVKCQFLNDFLKTKLGKCSDKIFIKQNLDIIAKLHYEICNVVKLTSYVMGQAILGNILMNYITLLLLIMTFFNINQERRGLYMYYLCLDIIPLIIMGMVTDRIEYEVNKIGRILFEIQMAHISTKLSRQVILL